MRVTFLGTADAFNGGGRRCAALLVEDRAGGVFVDCGPTTVLALRRAGVALESIDAIALTHLHGDHVGGLLFFTLAMVYPEGGAPRRRPLRVLGPALARATVEALDRLLYPDLAGRARPFETTFEAIAPGEARDFAGRRFTAFLVQHGRPGVLTALGYRIGSEEKRLAVTGDAGAADATRGDGGRGGPPRVRVHAAVRRRGDGAAPRGLRDRAPPSRVERAVRRAHAPLGRGARGTLARAPIPGVEVAEDGLAIDV